MTTEALSATLDAEALQLWSGRTERVDDIVTPRLEASFRATFDRAPGAPAFGDIASLGIHWCLAPTIAATDALGDDGNPRRPGISPPAQRPRRTWSGGELHFLSPLRVGDTVTRVSEIENAALTNGRNGELCCASIRHTWSTTRGPAIRERQDLVYRRSDESADACSPTPERDVETEALWRRSYACDPILLFRYSALGFDGHRIHFDRPYVTAVEGYSGLVVHTPLQATSLISLAADAVGEAPRRVEYRGLAPLLADGPFTAKGARKGVGWRLWICDSAGRATMTAQAEW